MHTPGELAAMLDIKHAFDPHNLLNPGKIFPLPDTEHNHAALDGGMQFTATLHPVPHPAVGIPHDIPPVPPLLARNVFTPASALQAAEELTVCSAARKRVHISSSSRLDPTCHANVLLSTSALKGIQTYAPEDMYITVGAGTLLTEIQDYLKADAKWLPLASPYPTATIGGLVATNTNAPLRMRYGAIRDLVLCATVALADGRVIRTGRPVIKNVAGYDLTKVFIGSRGTLGLLTDITLKIVVPPRSRRTLLVPIDDLRSGLLYARKLLPLALVASGLVLCNGHNIAGVSRSPYLLAYTAEGIPEDVHAELDEVRSSLRSADAPPPIELQSRSATDIWSGMLRNAASKGILQLHIGLPAKDVPAYAHAHAAILNASDFLLDIANGMIYAAHSTYREDLQTTSAWIEQLRRPALALDGYTVVTNMPESLRGTIDEWGYKPETLDIMHALKAQWDPQSILNGGEFIL